MGDKIITGAVTILTAIVGVAIIATLVSRNSNTSGVLQAGFGGFSQSLSAALGPVSGGNNFGF